MKERQAKMAREGKKLGETKRPKYLLSGLLKCGECGGGYSKANHGRYGCSLKSSLLTDELLHVFCTEYTNHINKLRITKSAEASRIRRELAKLARAKERYMTAIAEWRSGCGCKR